MDLKTAALLNTNDPERLRVEQEVCQTAEGREAWLRAVHEAERLRANLRSIAASPDSVNQILLLARTSKQHKVRYFYIGGIAAAIILSTASWWTLAQRPDKPKIIAATFNHEQVRRIDLSPEVKHVALLAMENFEAGDKVVTSAGNMNTLLNKLPGSSALPKQVPDLGPLQQLTGGKVVSLADRPALLTRWTETVADGDTHEIALQQLYAAELNFPTDMNPVLVHIDPPDQAGKPTCDVLVWTQSGIAYMLVAHSSDGCARRALQALKEKMGPAYPASSIN